MAKKASRSKAVAPKKPVVASPAVKNPAMSIGDLMPKVAPKLKKK